MAAAPAGWPRDLPPAGTAEFEARVCGWLLDRGPSDLRSSPVRSMPLVLARIVAHAVDGTLVGMRDAYASARVELGDVLDAEQLTTAQAAIEAEGARLLQVQREVRLVEDVLRRSGSVRPRA